MLALAVSYEIQCRFTAVVPVMVKGFDHATQLAMSVAAAAGKLFGLPAVQIENAISIATANNVSLACIHVEPVSQWKGFSPGWTGMRAVYAASMAKRGFTGPVTMVTFGSEQYVWKPDGAKSYADPDGPPVARVIQGQSVHVAESVGDRNPRQDRP